MQDPGRIWLCGGRSSIVLGKGGDGLTKFTMDADGLKPRPMYRHESRNTDAVLALDGVIEAVATSSGSSVDRTIQGSSLHMML